jgi:hypothetical protein
MDRSLRLDPAAKIAILVGAALFFLGGAGWALYGPEIFITTVMAGLAYCF